MRTMAVLALAVCACGDKPAKAPAADPVEQAAPPPSASASEAGAPEPAAPISSSALPPPTPKKPGCLDSTRGAKHTFVG